MWFGSSPWSPLDALDHRHCLPAVDRRRPGADAADWHDRRARSVTPPNAAPPAAEQTAPASPAPAAHTRKHRRTLQERFDEANTTHDGHLTAEQARAGLPSVARDFDAIDTAHKGYVTIDDIKAHRAAVRAAHRAAKQKS